MVPLAPRAHIVSLACRPAPSSLATPASSPLLGLFLHSRSVASSTRALAPSPPLRALSCPPHLCISSLWFPSSHWSQQYLLTCLLVFLLPLLNYSSSWGQDQVCPVFPECMQRLVTAISKITRWMKKTNKLRFECRINEWMKLCMLRIQDPLFELVIEDDVHTAHVTSYGRNWREYTSSRCFSGD